MSVMGSINSYAQGQPEKHIERTYSISTLGNITLSSAYSEIEIFTWDQNSVKVTGELIYDGKYDVDVQKLLNVFKNSFDAESSNNSLTLNLRLIKSSSETWFKRTTILTNGDKISISPKKIKTKYKLWMPRLSVNFILSNVNLQMGNYGDRGSFEMRYSTATIGDGGSSVFNLNNTDLRIGTIGKAAINARYSKVNIKEALDVQVDSNNDSFVFGSLNNIEIKTRYSKIDIKKALDVQVDSNNDSFVFGSLNDISAIAKYSTFLFEDNGNYSKFDVNNTDISVKDFKTMQISAKYSNFNLGNIGEVTVLSSHSSTFDFSSVNTIVCRGSKYDKFRLGRVSASAEFDGYNSEVNIVNTAPSFRYFSGDLKYGSFLLKLDPSISVALNCQSTYGEINFARNRFRQITKSEKSGSITVFEGSTDSNPKCSIRITAYNTKGEIK